MKRLLVKLRQFDEKYQNFLWEVADSKYLIKVWKFINRLKRSSNSTNIPLSEYELFILNN